MYDVVIVGGGPAGSTAGIVLSKSGLSVAIVDKHVFPRDKLCGGALTYKTELLLESVGIKDYASVIDYETNRYGIFWGKEEIFKGNSQYRFLFVKRKEYDTFLLEKAKESGANLFLGERVIDIDFKKNAVITDKGKTYRFKYLIGADGVHSTVRKKLQEKNLIPTTIWRKNLANAIEIYIDRKAINIDVSYPYIILGYVKWGYAWIFPNRDTVVAGIGGLIPKNKNLIQSFYAFLSDFFPNYKPEKIMGHPIPFGNFIKNPCYKNILLVGDAGGITNPASGEGIFSSQKSGQLAAISIIKNITSGTPLCETYKGLLENFIYKDFSRDLKIRNIAYSVNSKLLTKLIFNLLHKKLEKVVHT